MRLSFQRWASGLVALASLLPVVSDAAEARGSQAGPSDGVPVPARPDSVGVFEEPEGRLTLADALQAVLGASPLLLSWAWEAQAREAEVLQSGARPNPEMSFELENLLGSGEFEGMKSSEATLSLSQAIELGGKRGSRQRLAETELDLAGRELEIDRIDALATATQRFVAVVAAQDRVTLAKDLVGVSEAMLEAVSRRVEAGAESPVERSRARVELETRRVDLEQSRRSLDLARRQLAAAWGSGAPRFTEAIGDLAAISAPPSWDSLRQRIAGSPVLQRWVVEHARRKADLALQRSLGVPNLGLGAGVRRFSDSGERALLFGVNLDLPLSDRNRGAARAAELRVRRGEAEHRAASVSVEGDLASAYESLSAAHAEATSLRATILPEAESAFTTAQDVYRSGRLRLTDVLDTERTLFELRGRHVDALARYHDAMADVERILGAPADDGIDAVAPRE